MPEEVGCQKRENIKKAIREKKNKKIQNMRNMLLKRESSKDTLRRYICLRKICLTTNKIRVPCICKNLKLSNSCLKIGHTTHKGLNNATLLNLKASDWF